MTSSKGFNFKILILVILGLSFFFGLTRKVFASQNYGEYRNVTGENCKPSQACWLEEGNSDSIFWLFEALGGRSNESGELETTGAVQYATGLIASLYASPPVSGIYYAHDTLHRLGATPAYAQGIGFSGLQPILPIWKSFRNITYVFFTIIFVVLGMAIMFRIKISPQAVITIENALPKIIAALILVTFSYAIAGFLIDFMYVLIALGITILKQSGVTASMYDLNVIGVHISLGEITPARVINSGFFGLVPMFFSVSTAHYAVAAIGAAIGAFIGGLLTIPAGGSGALVGMLVGPAIISIIWVIIGLFLLLKLLFALIKSYIKIIISVILGPIQIMMGAIPGLQTAGFGPWIKGLFTEILIFPAVVLVAMVGVAIIQSPNLGQMWQAPLIGLPFLGTRSSFWVKATIGMGFLLILANIPDMIRNAMGIKDSGFGISGALGPIIPVAKAGAAGGVGHIEQRLPQNINWLGQRVGDKGKWGTFYKEFFANLKDAIRKS